MNDALRAKLMPKFIAVARDRLAKARAADDAQVARDELHALAGESSMLGERELGEATRATMREADAWRGGDAAAHARCTAAIDGLSARIDALATAS